MDRYAVLGQPVAHSLSPQIQQDFFAQIGESLSYERIEVTPELFVETLTRLHAENYRGLAVTLPHKLAALSAAGEVSDAARIAGAANALVRLAKGWRADNTDGAGLIRDLMQNLKLTLAGKRILLLGAGGAARGVLKPLLDENPCELIISSRNPWTVEKIATEFIPHGPVRPCTHIALKGFSFDLIINATSASYQGQTPKLPPGVLAKNGACYDLNYGKTFEPFRAWAKAQNAALIADGLGMLVEQAAAMFELWRGKRPQTAAVLAKLRR